MSKSTSQKFYIFFLVLIVIGLVIAVGKEAYRKYQVDKEIAVLKQEIESLREKNEAISGLLDYFSSEQSLEKEARLKLNLLKEGEKLVIISSDLSKSRSLTDVREEEISNFKKWLKYLFDKEKYY